ncbi:MAG: 6-bladed beta-propeller, partial [Gemmatimonadetes bacterium]|nr:6-bladed beta-propeller [Gemmatimonadota bacterium]
ATPTRETLPNGALLVRYPALPAIDHVGPEVAEAHVDLRLGTRGGDDPNFIFGDIRGVQAASDGTIFVLDYQAIEVRVFSPDGEFLRTIVRQGEGPGEVREANGIVLSGDTLLWVNDHGQWAVVGVDPQGEELRRFSKPIRSYGYIWDGTFDRQGRYWRQDEHADDEELVDEETGPYEESFRSLRYPASRS